MSATPIVHNADKQRFEARTNEGGLALLEYRRRQGEILFTHTEVPSAAEGKGIATSLAEAALAYARDNQLEIVPLCEFVVAYIRQHTEYLPLVSARHRTRVERHSA
jgi:uncharacterized protein